MHVAEEVAVISVPVGGRRTGAWVDRWWSSRLGWRLGGEVALLVSLLLLYRWVRYLVRDQVLEAFENLDHVVALERWLGLFPEPDLNRLVVGSDALVWLANRYYVHGHFPVMIAVLAWLYVRHHDVYRPFRSLLILSSALGMVIHAVYPLAPPRMAPGLGFVDTLAQFGPTVYSSGSVTADQANRLAAMPSLHAGWAALAAIAVVSASGHRHRWWAMAHPVLMTVTIMATANHWWVDAAVGVSIVAVVALHPRLRPWDVRSGPAPSGAGEAADDRGERVVVGAVGDHVRHAELLA
ncbi:MAG: phosphatase PAP2 family protein [Actinomycetota bacterium]